MTRASNLLRRPAERGGAILKVILLIFLIVIGLVLYLARGPILRGVAAAWIVDEPLEKAQAIVVLGGDSRTGDRVRHAVGLYKAGWAPRIVLSGAPFRTYFNETELMEREARELGVPADHLILAPTGANSTLEEAVKLRPVLAKHNFRNLLVVTSNFHTRRAKQIFLGVYRPRATIVRVSAAPDQSFDPAAWWQSREGRKLLFLEVLKWTYTWWELWTLPDDGEPEARGGEVRSGSASHPVFSVLSPVIFSPF
ncbi:MAG: YdcF family protein [Candidatus Acidiferrales bacterium]